MNENTTTPIVWISHAVSGDVEGNLAKITEICEEVQRQGVQPLFPSFTSRRYKVKLTPEESERQVRAFFSALVVHELWLYGDEITVGMQREIRIAREYGVKVVAKTPATAKALEELKI